MKDLRELDADAERQQAYEDLPPAQPRSTSPVKYVASAAMTAGCD